MRRRTRSVLEDAYQCLQIQVRDRSLLVERQGYGLPGFLTLLDLLERCPKFRGWYDTVDLIEKTTRTTREWGGLWNIDELCRHVLRDDGNRGLSGEVKRGLAEGRSSAASSRSVFPGRSSADKRYFIDKRNLFPVKDSTNKVTYGPLSSLMSAVPRPSRSCALRRALSLFAVSPVW
jgi:hypothetical protein